MRKIRVDIEKAPWGEVVMTTEASCLATRTE
jgi:hypothetical protein